MNSAVNIRGMLVLLICVQILVRLDCFSHSIIMGGSCTAEVEFEFST